MLKISLVGLFLATMATFTIAASALPVPPQVGTRTVVVAELG